MVCTPKRLHAARPLPPTPAPPGGSISWGVVSAAQLLLRPHPAPPFAGAWDDCWVGSARRTRTPDGGSNAYLQIANASAALCNVGVNSWGNRAEVGFAFPWGPARLG